MEPQSSDTTQTDPIQPTDTPLLPNSSFQLTDIWGMTPTEDQVPTYNPTRFEQQYRIVSNGGSSAAYVYDQPNHRWIGPLMATSATPAAPLMPFYGSMNEIANTYLYTFAYLSDWSLFVSPAGSGAGVAETFTNFGKDTQAPFLQFTSPGITPAATIIHSCYHTTTSKFLMASEAVTPTVYSYDGTSTLTTETAVTISGTTIATCLGLATDNTYVYIMVTTSSVKYFTFAGSTLTFVGTITLGTATERYLAVDTNYFYSMDATNTKYYVYNKTTGTTVSTLTVPNLTTTNFRGLTIDPDGKLRQLMSSRVIGAATTNQWFISRLSLI